VGHRTMSPLVSILYICDPSQKIRQLDLSQDKLEQEGELKRIKSEVDWDLELSHVAVLNEERHLVSHGLIFSENPTK